MSTYAVIKNPMNNLLKYECWYSGEAEVVDEQGFKSIKNICKPVRAFFTSQQATDYIKYQQQVKAFKAGLSVDNILNNEKEEVARE